MILLVLASACALLEEQRELPTEVAWSGWVLVDRPSTGETGVLENGALTFTDTLGEPLAEASQPYADSPGWWQADVPVATEVAIRVEGGPDDELVPMVWRGRTPSGRGYWLEGALFTRELSYYEDFFDALDELPGVDPEPLSLGEVAHLWGEPMDPEAWRGALLGVTDAEGEAHEVLTFEVDEEGSLVESTGPVDLFLVVNLPPGITTLSVTTATGEVVDTSWPTRGGDLLSAIYYALPAP